MEHFYAMIMAGGGGTRLWPMSRQDMPKQMLPLVDDASMFKTSVDRLGPLFSPDRIYVVTGRKYLYTLRQQAPEIPEQNFVIEPYGRDSGPAAALGMSVIQARDPQATVAILTADHHITKKSEFRDALSAAYYMAQKGHILTLGITPTFPSTGFGYIWQGNMLEKVGDFKCYVSKGFKEKPNAAKAAEFLDSGEYTWNSGMFIWKASQAMSEFQRQQPEMYAQFVEISKAVDTPEFETRLESIWDNVRKISLDYAVMEGAENVAVIPVDIGWSDVGSWSSLYDVLKLDKNGNAFKGRQPDRVVMDTRETLVYSDKLVVTIGIDGIIVVDTPDALLICHKDRTQDVKEVVNQLLNTKNYRYL